MKGNHFTPHIHISHNPAAPCDGYDEADDTEEKARSVRLAKQIDHMK